VLARPGRWLRAARIHVPVGAHSPAKLSRSPAAGVAGWARGSRLSSGGRRTRHKAGRPTGAEIMLYDSRLGGKRRLTRVWERLGDSPPRGEFTDCLGQAAIENVAGWQSQCLVGSAGAERIASLAPHIFNAGPDGWARSCHGSPAASLNVFVNISDRAISTDPRLLEDD